jgi:hypothetical protein
MDSLEAATANARRVLDEEELDYYQKLALPSFDVLDMLTASRSSVATLVSSLVPTAPAVRAVAVGTKTTLGAAAGPEEDAGARSEATSSLAGATPHLGLASVTAIRSTQSISPRALDQTAVDACTSIAFRGSAEISDFFAGQGGFFAWYNETLARHPAFAHRSRIRSTPLMRERFDDFWDQIPAISGKQEISGLQFCALASVAIQETGGDFWANPERVGNAEHPGLAYAFDQIPGLKASYNTLEGNQPALKLFNDAIFRKAHGHRPGAIQPGKVDQKWEGDTWPVGVPVKVDPEVNGFIMQADFYKFRGRGVIQTTGRSNYKALINFLLSTTVEFADRSGA